MNKNDVLLDLGWNNFYKKLQNFGKTFINEENAINLSKIVGDYHTIHSRLLNNEIPDWIQHAFPIQLEVLQIFAMMPNSIGMIHKDGLARKCALNVPLTGYTEGYMQWFDKEFNEHLVNTEYSQVRLTKNEVGQKIYRMDETPTVSVHINAPTLLNTDVWHRIDNSQNKNFRWILSLRFSCNPGFTNVANVLKS